MQLHTLYAIAHELEVPVTTLLPSPEAALRAASPQVKRAIQNLKNLQPNERKILEEMLSSAVNGASPIQRSAV